MENTDVETPPPPSKKQRIKKGTACTACRAKKRRCNAAKPMCSLCVRDGETECVYVVMTTRPRTQILQQKIEDLETQVATLVRSNIAAVDAGGHGGSNSTRFPRVATLPAHKLAATPLPYPSTSSASVFPQRHVQAVSAGDIDPLIGSWWNTNDYPPSGLVTILTRLFVEQEHQQSHDPRPAEFYASLHDPNPEAGIHPALRNVIFLVACGYYPGPLTLLEPVFLRRATFHLTQSLANADRLLDYVEAYALLAIYHIYKGRYFQGSRNAAAAIMFAVACGLHAISPPEWYPKNVPSLLPPPDSRTEIRRRVRVWWMIFTLNRLGSSATNVDGDVEDEKIETSWDLPPGSESDNETYSGTVASLFARDSKDTYVFNDTANVIRSKCAALVERSLRLGFIAPLTPESEKVFWEKFEIMDQAIRQVTASLPSIFEEPRYEPDAPHIESRTKLANKYTIVPHFLVCDAALSLHAKLARAGNTNSRNTCLEVARKALPIIRQLLEQNMGCSIFSYLVVTWSRIFQVLAVEYNRLLAAGDNAGARLIIPDLQILSKAIGERTKYFRLTCLMIAELKAEFISLHSEPDIF
ncbi:hypothetical protein BOTBODRAFT_26276 [Botryobasidium botryosum FD-172 SS1]|uniref:Zn(2)-C6 fungal-type domain-containing protein n=1 Tax=Botryobasidium botryosum (strain FD-172 SS1) TaxID=930990 RepID=A0A067N217_BOTB1|nr:hypothetical protein BOTBODRAFT_26276 [Botryobasidium botryosum FD-172 SS1]